MARTWSAADVDALARQWWHRHRNDPRLRHGLAVVADGIESLRSFSISRRREVEGQEARVTLDESRRRGESIHFRRRRSPVSDPGRVAFVYPGLGSYFAGMGRDLSASLAGSAPGSGFEERLSPRSVRS